MNLKFNRNGIDFDFMAPIYGSMIGEGFFMDIKDSIIVVTGGASGLGAAAAEFLSEKGGRVALFDLNKEELDNLASKINGLAVVCDVTDEESVKRALKQVKETFGTPNVCINCAGILGGERIEGRDGPMKVEHFRKIIDVDLVGTFIVMDYVLADMIKLEPDKETGERGVVINVASIAAYEGQIGQVAYSAAKGGVIGMTLPVAREMGDYGVRVVAVAPGVFETPMMQKASEKIRSGLLASTVFPKRFGIPKEFAKFMGCIIENPMINGETMPLDGAIRMPAK